MKEYKTVLIETNQGWGGSKGTANTAAVDDVLNKMAKAGWDFDSTFGLNKPGVPGSMLPRRANAKDVHQRPSAAGAGLEAAEREREADRSETRCARFAPYPLDGGEGFLNPNGVCHHSPGLRRSRYPGKADRKQFQPQRGWVIRWE